MSVVLSFRDLEVWQLGMQLVVSAYRVTDRFPATERFGLTSQIRRAAISIPSNIAEGHANVDRVRQMLHGLRRSLERRRQASVGLAFLAVLLTSTLLWA